MGVLATTSATNVRAYAGYDSMTPAEIREAVARLVEAGEKATPGEWKRYAAAPGAASQVVLVDDVTVKVAPYPMRSRLDALFIAAAGNARPALTAIAGKVWLDVETVRTLIDATQDFRDSFERETGLVATNSRAALAAAEAELARVEGPDA